MVMPAGRTGGNRLATYFHRLQLFVAVTCAAIGASAVSAHAEEWVLIESAKNAFGFKYCIDRSSIKKDSNGRTYFRKRTVVDSCKETNAIEDEHAVNCAQDMSGDIIKGYQVDYDKKTWRETNSPRTSPAGVMLRWVCGKL